MKVRDAELSSVLRRFVATHDAEHPVRAGGNLPAKYIKTANAVGPDGITPVVRGLAYICTRSGVGYQRVQWMLSGGNREYWDLDVADKVLTAIDRQDALVNGEIEVVE